MKITFFIALLCIVANNAWAVPEQSSLNQYTKQEVAQHRTLKKGVWVTYQGGVYDVTEFIKDHPGGKQIMNAAGKALERYWKIYKVHNKDNVLEILEAYRIGHLQGWTPPKNPSPSVKHNEYAMDPRRDPQMVVHGKTPFRGETPTSSLGHDFLTPNALFYVRNHFPVPVVDEASYQLNIIGEKGESLSLNIQDLKTKFKTHTITATLQCAGNRRSEMSRYKKVMGTAWKSGAMSTAQFKGVRLVDVLEKAGINFKDLRYKHVQFKGLDHNAEKTYGASIPVEIAFNPKRDVLLAYEMNGVPLPRDHGYPLRVIVPGVLGARNVKWLAEIKVSENESPAFWQQETYKLIKEDMDPSDALLKKLPAIQEMPVQSAISSRQEIVPLSKEARSYTVKGYAWSGGGRGIQKVEISTDGGTTWALATLKPGVDQPDDQAWAWTPWEATVPLPKGVSEIDLYSRATDVKGHTQPQNIEPLWNKKGFLNNAWSHVKLVMGNPQETT